MLPPQIAEVLDHFGIIPATKAALLEMYLQVGTLVFEVFSEFAERFPTPSQIQPEDLDQLQAAMVEYYLRQHHPEWLELRPTPSFYLPRCVEGRASGFIKPLGKLSDSEGFTFEVASTVRKVLAPEQPVPKGLLVLAKNAHFSGRNETVTFDIVAEDFAEALAIALAKGRQHTTPGSIGETSSTFETGRHTAIIWEVQPNAYKPSAGRNSELAKSWRRNRNWHIATLVATILWYQKEQAEMFVLRGQSLVAAHQANPREPVTEDVMQLHDRTVQYVVTQLGGRLELPDEEVAHRLLESELMKTCMNVKWQNLVARQGAVAALSKITFDPVNNQGNLAEK